MTNLDKLLKKVERNSLNGDTQTKSEFTIGGETYEVLSMTRKQKRDFIYNQKIGQNELNAGALIKSFIPIIYNCFQLKDLAVKAKDAGYIKSYNDVVEMLFSPEELIEVVTYLVETNNINGDKVEDVVDEIKKQ